MSSNMSWHEGQSNTTAQLQGRKHDLLHTWLFQLKQHFIQSGDLLFLWGVYHHHGAAHEAQHAAQLSQQVEPLSQQIRRQDGTARDRKTMAAGTLKKKQHLKWCRIHDTRTPIWNTFVGFLHVITHSCCICWQMNLQSCSPEDHSSCISKVKKHWTCQHILGDISKVF